MKEGEIKEQLKTKGLSRIIDIFEKEINSSRGCGATFMQHRQFLISGLQLIALYIVKYNYHEE